MFKVFKKDRERDKDNTVNSILDDIIDDWRDWSPTEQTEIFNRVGLRLMERKKEGRSKLIKEARELQQSMKDIKI